MAKTAKSKTAGKKAGKKTAKTTASKKKTVQARAKTKTTTTARTKSPAKPRATRSTKSAAAGSASRSAAATRRKPIVPISVPVKPEVEDTPALTEAQLRKVDTGLTRKDLQHYRELLLQKRAEIIGDVESLQVDTKNNGGNLSHMPVHMADVGSDHYEQEFTLGLVESERKLLREIDDALTRIQKGIYGVCMERGVPIGRPRLDAKPWAKYCIEVVREMEKRGMSSY